MTGHFMRGDAITGVSNKPDGDKPFAHSNRAVLKDSAEFDGELLLAGKTLPCTAGRDKGDFRRLADGTGHVAIRPTHQDGEVMGIIQVGEVFNGFYKGLRQATLFAHLAPRRSRVLECLSPISY